MIQSMNQQINKSISKSIKQSINQSIHQSINSSINQFIYQSIHLSIYQFINQSSKQASNQLINQSINEPINQSTKQPTNQVINQSTNQSINQSISQNTHIHYIYTYTLVWSIWSLFAPKMGHFLHSCFFSTITRSREALTRRFCRICFFWVEILKPPAIYRQFLYINLSVELCFPIAAIAPRRKRYLQFAVVARAEPSRWWSNGDLGDLGRWPTACDSFKFIGQAVDEIR